MKPRNGWRVLLSLVLAGSLAVGKSPVAQATSNSPFCDQDTSTMSEGKKARLKAYCDSLPQGIPTEPKLLPLDKPRPLPPLTEEEKRGGALYGVLDGWGSLPKWLHAENFKIVNEWCGENNIVYAGSLRSDPSQGILFLADRFVGPVPQELGRYLTTAKDGALRVESDEGLALTLVATNGAKYRFNVAQRHLIRLSP